MRIKIFPFTSTLTAVLALGLLNRSGFADGISVSPSEGVGLTPIVVTVTGFVPDGGTYPNAYVTVDTNGYLGDCPGNQACVLSGNMGYYRGTHLLQATGAWGDGGNRHATTTFKVLDPEMMISQTCGTNGSKVLITGNHFNRNSTVYAYTGSALSNSNGQFAVEVTINAGNGPINLVATDGFNTLTNQFTVGPGICEPQAGTETGGTGGPMIRHPGGQPVPFSPGDPVRPGDEIITGAGGKLDVLLSDGTTLTIAESSRVKLDRYLFTPSAGQNDITGFSVLGGAFRYAAGLMEKHDDNVKLNTTFGVIGIRGTEFITRRDPCSTTQEVYLIHGQLAIKPTNSTTTNIVDAPASIFYDATNVTTSGLTQAAYDALKNEINQTNAVTFSSWVVQYFGCTNGNAAAAATADPDGDGQNNYAEFQSHTDPTTNASVFKLLGAAREGDGVRLVWQTHGGITNVVQAASSLGGIFSDTSSNIVIPGDVDVTTNYLHSGIVTNAAARFYRVRLAP